MNAFRIFWQETVLQSGCVAPFVIVVFLKKVDLMTVCTLLVVAVHRSVMQLNVKSVKRRERGQEFIANFKEALGT